MLLLLLSLAFVPLLLRSTLKRKSQQRKSEKSVNSELSCATLRLTPLRSSVCFLFPISLSFVFLLLLSFLLFFTSVSTNLIIQNDAPAAAVALSACLATAQRNDGSRV
mgnify:CR=1 FL=1